MAVTDPARRRLGRQVDRSNLRLRLDAVRAVVMCTSARVAQLPPTAELSTLIEVQATVTYGPASNKSTTIRLQSERCAVGVQMNDDLSTCARTAGSVRVRTLHWHDKGLVRMPNRSDHDGRLFLIGRPPNLAITARTGEGSPPHFNRTRECVQKMTSEEVIAMT